MGMKRTALISVLPLLACTGGLAEPLLSWNFTDGTDGFSYNKDWNYQYDGGKSTLVRAEGGRLFLNVDYSRNAAESWSQLTLTNYGAFSLRGADSISFDFFFNPSLLEKTGSFMVKVVLQDASYNGIAEGVATVDTSHALAVSAPGGMRKAHVTVRLDNPVPCESCAAIAISLVGCKTAYKGSLYIDDVAVEKGSFASDGSVDSTVRATGGQQRVELRSRSLVLPGKDGKAVTAGTSSSLQLADPLADKGTRSLYAYLEAVGKSPSVMFGHQNDTTDKAGGASLTFSDTKDVTGSLAAVIGIDALSLTGNEFSAGKYQSRYGESFPAGPAGNVQAAAALTNGNIREGAIITLSCHMPNFSLVKERKGYNAKKDPSYARYDFSGYTPNVTTGDVMNEILPGGKYSGQFDAYLDMVADYISRVDGPVLFRPFHENTGSWFWWGEAFCDPEQFKNVFRYTVVYLRDKKGLHNVLYVYGPGSEAKSTGDYGERYPGDAYVDMVGFDMYHRDPSPDDTWFEDFRRQLDIVQEFARLHGKLFAVTETGVATSRADEGEHQTALHRQGNKVPGWFRKVLDLTSDSAASYFLVWADFSKADGYYIPYVDRVNADGTLHGHEMLDEFLRFFNDPRSVFAVNQKDALAAREQYIDAPAAAAQELRGFICAPVARGKLSGAVKVSALLEHADKSDAFEFVFTGRQGSVTLPAVRKKGDVTCTATLPASKAKSLGNGWGSIELRSGTKTLAKVSVLFNKQ